MFETIWADRARWQLEKDAAALVQPASRWRLPVTRLALTHWEEHCHECAVPQCYAECLVYRARADKRCRRFDYGCVPDSRFRGPLGYGVDVRFGRWAKLETEFHRVAGPLWLVRVIDRLSRSASSVARWISPLLFFVHPIRRATWALEHARNWALRTASRWCAGEFTTFVIEAHNLESSPVNLILQCGASDRGVFHRRSIPLQPGLNQVQVPFHELEVGARANVRVSVFPENDRNARILFTWLDFVVLSRHPQSAAAVSPTVAARPADQVKCIAWDLDNTLWDGVLIEDGLEKVRLRTDVIDVIRRLDERGVIHTVVSKNTHEQAWAALEALGIQEYFVFPAINWGRKSENLAQVAKRINIGLDAIALVDDSPFERNEVAANLPMVRVFSDREIGMLPSLPALNLPQTEMSGQRRHAYRAEMLREQFRAHSGRDDIDYLKACEIRVTFFCPRLPEQVARCHELIQRSNQLNLCTRRYTPAQFQSLLGDDESECFGIHCADRFGDYGIVGFVSVRLQDQPMLVDLVLSCRVAKRRVEHALLKWLGSRYARRGKAALEATLIHSSRNGVLAEVFDDLPFDVVSRDEVQTIYRLPLEPVPDIVDVVAVIEDSRIETSV
jgi:FkbH-like protein